MALLDVVCVGSATSDTIASVDCLPSEDERVVASAIICASGGPAATAAVAMARLGLAVGFCGVVGDDEAGRAVRNELVREGVHVEWLLIDPGVQTARSVVLASAHSAGRSIVTTEAPAPAWDSVPMGASTWLHADQTGCRAVRRATAGRVDGPLVALDGGNHLAAKDLAGIELYVPAAPALLARYGTGLSIPEAMQLAVRDGAARVVVTDGPRVTHVLDHGSAVETVEGFVVEVISTLGAGDVFHGALLAAVVNGRTLGEAARIANAAAALSCRALDGRSAIPGRDELCGFLSGTDPELTGMWPLTKGVDR